MFTGQLSDLSESFTALALSQVADDLAVPVVEIGHGCGLRRGRFQSRHQPLLEWCWVGSDYSATPDELVRTGRSRHAAHMPYPMPHCAASPGCACCPGACCLRRR
jgi:hypothetical protein